ncbi:MAG: hypothetical protein ACFNOJ_05545 [Prevotella nigrescens]
MVLSTFILFAKLQANVAHQLSYSNHESGVSQSSEHRCLRRWRAAMSTCSVTAFVVTPLRRLE